MSVDSKKKNLPAGPETSTHDVISQEHSFLMDQNHVIEAENGLLKLLTDFKSGKLNAFG